MSQSSAYYLNDRQRQCIERWRASWLWRRELPTWCVIAAIYGGWFGVVLNWQTLGAGWGTPLLIVLTTWYMSLQHELIHGHPTRFPALNALLGLLPLAVWYPYAVYRDGHLAHHRNENLTNPLDDPESYYFTAERWQHAPRWWRGLIRLRNTFPGRLLLGPALGIASLLREEVSRIAGGDRGRVAVWAVHFTLLALLLLWLAQRGIAPGFYLFAISYPALGLAMVRSFYEHRAVDEPPARSIINEAAWPWRLLFLNLNYHIVHHDLPGVPWYGLRRIYLADRGAYQVRNRGFVAGGYGTWLRQYFWRALDVGAWPLQNVRESEAPPPALPEWLPEVNEYEVNVIYGRAPF